MVVAYKTACVFLLDLDLSCDSRGYSDEGHTTFPGRYAYFHDPDGNCIEIIDLYKGQPNTTET